MSQSLVKPIGVQSPAFTYTTEIFIITPKGYCGSWRIYSDVLETERKQMGIPTADFPAGPPSPRWAGTHQHRSPPRTRGWETSGGGYIIKRHIWAKAESNKEFYPGCQQIWRPIPVLLQVPFRQGEMKHGPCRSCVRPPTELLADAADTQNCWLHTGSSYFY